MVNKHIIILALAAILTLAACGQTPVDSDEQAALATAVEATLAAAPEDDTATATTAPGATQKAQPTATSEPQTPPKISMQDFLLVYTIEGNLWTLSPDGSSEQIASHGDIVDVLLSDDRQLIVYVRQTLQPDFYEVRAINADGTKDRQILSQETLDGLYPLDGALHYLVSKVEFIPTTHILLFNTRAIFDGPGLIKNDDLYQLDTDTGELAQMLSRQRGGDFQVSPDGGKLAISKPDSLAMADIDGLNLRPDLVTFQPIITYSEYQYYPAPVWALDSSRFGAFIPSSDPLSENPSGTVWIVPVDGAAQASTPIQGQVFFPQSNGNSLLSVDMQTVVNVRETEGLSFYIANIDGSESQLYDQGDLQWIAWNPDGSRFAYRRDQATLVLGQPDRDPQPIANGRTLRWLSPELFITQAGQRGDWTLILGDVDGTTTSLVKPEGERLVYDIR